MIDWLLVARSNRYGLTADTEIVAEAIRAAGGSCDTASTRGRGWLERLFGPQARPRASSISNAPFPRWFSAADRNYLIPNQERFPARHIGRLRRIDRVLAKTLHAESIFSEMGCRDPMDRLHLARPPRRHGREGAVTAFCTSPAAAR
jgi:hypothetical protein